MVPPESFSIEAPHSSMDFCNGCDGGTQCESFSSKVLSCAEAVQRPRARPSATTPQNFKWRIRRMRLLPQTARREPDCSHLIADGFGCTSRPSPACGDREGACGSNACSGVEDWPPLPSRSLSSGRPLRAGPVGSAPPPQAGEEALLRFRLVNAVPIRRRWLSAIARDALDIHVVKSCDIEAVGGLAAAIDEIERLVPLLLAIADDHARIELAQLPVARILLDFRAPDHRVHRFRLFFALHLDKVDLHRGELLLGLFRGT